MLPLTHAGVDNRTGRPREHEWAKHQPTIRQLYVDQGKTLKAVMDIMHTNHDFKASAKMYKQKFKRWGFQKNIRLHGGDEEISYQAVYEVLNNTTASDLAPSEVQLASGQVVDLDRLAAHLRRKMMHKRFGQKAVPLSVVRPPEGLYMCEAVLNNTRTYIAGKYQETLTSVSSIDHLRISNPSTRKWNAFFYSIRGALMHPPRFGQALILMRQAPEELKGLLANQPPGILSSFFMFMVYVTQCLNSLGDADEAKQFSGVVRALIKYAGAIFTNEGTSPHDVFQSRQRHPLPQMLRALARVDDAELYPLFLKAWRLSCQTWESIAWTASASDAKLVAGLGARARCHSAAIVSDWINFYDAAPPTELPPHLAQSIDGTLGAMRQVYGESIASEIDTLWERAEFIEDVVRQGKLLPDESKEFVKHNNFHLQWYRVMEMEDIKDKPRVFALRSFANTRLGLQFMNDMEGWFYDWGDHDRVAIAATMRGNWTGDL